MDRVSVFIVGLCLAGMVSGENKIPAVIGEEVTLPCKAKERWSYEVVEWSRPNGTNTEYILVFRHNELVPMETSERYKGRVKFEDLQSGNISLVLKNVKPEDKGRYDCYIKKESNRSKRSFEEPASIVYLDVHYPSPPHVPPPSGRANIGLIAAAVALIAAVAAFVVKKKLKSSPPLPDKEAEKPLQIPPTAADPSIP